MRLTALRQIATVLVAMLLVSACGAADAERMNKAAEVILTQSANVTVDSAAVQRASTPETPLPPGAIVTATPSLVYARCLAREATTMHVQPDASTAMVIELAARDIFTAYGRTQDAAWVLGWRTEQSYGWASAAVVGCTVPIPELMPSDPNVLLTPIAVAQVETSTPTTSVASPTSSTNETGTPVPSPAPLTDTPPPPTEVPTVAPMDAPTLVPTETAITVLPSTATPTSAVAATAPPEAIASATPVVQIQVVTVVVTVTVPVYIEVTAAPTPLVTPTPLALPTATATTAATATSALTPPQSALGLACEVTPGTPVNFRLGPSRADRLIGTLRSGTQFLARGRNDDGTWLYGEGPRSTSGWLISSSVQCNGDIAALPVVDR